MTDPRIEQSLAEIIARWHDPEFWKEQGCRMDSGDCANELAAWHARAMKLANMMRCECRPISRQLCPRHEWLALLGDLK